MKVQSKVNGYIALTSETSYSAAVRKPIIRQESIFNNYRPLPNFAKNFPCTASVINVSILRYFPVSSASAFRIVDSLYNHLQNKTYNCKSSSSGGSNSSHKNKTKNLRTNKRSNLKICTPKFPLLQIIKHNYAHA